MAQIKKDKAQKKNTYKKPSYQDQTEDFFCLIFYSILIVWGFGQILNNKCHDLGL